MSDSTIAIVGSGIVGTTIAYLLTQKGYDVAIFEKGRDYPYPHAAQHQEEYFYNYKNPDYELPADLKNIDLSGSYQRNLTNELHTHVGGMATRWTGLCMRMRPNDFKTKTLYGMGEDWSISYNDLEPYYCKAEKFLGVAGTDADNPFAPPRSQPYPLPAFELSYDDRILAERLKKHGIILHTVPQARLSADYQGRPACDNYGPCYICPTGSRYSPNHHLALALKTGRCKVYTNVTVRRIDVDQAGQARTIVYRQNDAAQDQEHAAKIIIVGSGALESARLLLLSKNERHPNGIGNQSGHVGKHLTFHHFWEGKLQYKDALYPGRLAVDTGQSHQFLDPPTRGKHGGLKVEFSSRLAYRGDASGWQNGAQVVEDLKKVIYWRELGLHSETVPDAKKYVELSKQRDRFGDAFAHVHYELSEFDQETYKFARQVYDRFVEATGADSAQLADISQYFSVWHHMGTCRMGTTAKTSVVDSFGKVHGVPNLYVVGASNFVMPSAINPTLTVIALTVRSAEHIAEQL